MHLESSLPLQANTGTGVHAGEGGSLSFCLVTTFYPPYHFGGDAMYVYRLSNALARRGHRVTVVHSVDAYRLFRRGTVADAYPHEAGVTVRPIKSAVGPLTPLATYLSGRP